MSPALIITLTAAVLGLAARAWSLHQTGLSPAVLVSGATGLALLGLLLLWLDARAGSGRKPKVRLAVATLFLLSVVRGFASGESPADQGAAITESEEQATWLSGLVVGDPKPSRGGTRFTLDVAESSSGVAAGSRVTLWADSTSGVPRAFSRIMALAELREARRSTTPGGFDERRWLADQGATTSGRIRGAAWREFESAPPHPLRILWDLRHRWSQRIRARVPGEAGEFLQALVLGERGRVSPEVIDDFRRAGVLHLLALSGQHVALIAALLAGLCRLLGFRARLEAATAGLGVWLYALLTGASPSVSRAATGASLHFLGQFLGRKTSSWEILGWSAALGALFSPRLGLHVGFQLSLLASAGLIAISVVHHSLGNWGRERLRTNWPLWAPSTPERWLARVCSALWAIAGLPLATAAAQLALLPLLAGYFGTVSLVGLASNLLLIPLCAGALSLTVPMVLLDTLAPTPKFLWRSLALLTSIGLSAGEMFASWPGARMPCTLPPFLAGLAVVCLLVAGISGHASSSAKLRQYHPSTATAVAALSCVSLGAWVGILVCAFQLRPEPPTNTLSYWMLDVGQGDAQVLEFSDGRVLVVDTGVARSGFDAGARVLAPFLRARGYHRVDWQVITHEDQDHSGGLRSLTREIVVDRLAASTEALAALESRGALEYWRGEPEITSSGTTLMSGPGYRVETLWPPAGLTGLAPNQRSVVLLITVEDEQLVLPGDVDSTTESHWQGALPGPVDVLKLAHHGAGSSTGRRLLAVARPRMVLVSCGRGNRFGHPHPSVLERVATRGSQVRRTDLEGSVQLGFGTTPRRPPVAKPRLTPYR